MTQIRRLVLDVLQPREPEMTDYPAEISEMECVDGINSSLIEVDEKVRNVKVTVEGEIDEQNIRDKIEDIGVSIHSIDEVAAGEKLVEESKTLQD